MPKYLKRPLIIEAHKLTKFSHMEICRWMNSICSWTEEPLILTIPTLEGEMKATEGDYIIKGIAGEFYSCKSEIFEASYDLVEGE